MKHPAKMSISLCEELIKQFTCVGDLICDPFTGSGTTGLCAINHNRRFCGTEVQSSWVAHCKMLDLNVVQADSMLFKFEQFGQIDVCVTSPEYWKKRVDERADSSYERGDYTFRKKHMGVYNKKNLNLTRHALTLTDFSTMLLQVWKRMIAAKCHTFVVVVGNFAKNWQVIPVVRAAEFSLHSAGLQQVVKFKAPSLKAGPLQRYNAQLYAERGLDYSDIHNETVLVFTGRKEL